MEPAQGDSPKLPDMVMCGDHPSFTKSELNAKEDKPEAAQKDKPPMSYAKISPSASRIDDTSERTKVISEHALRLIEARRRVRSLEQVPRADDAIPGNRALVQAALGSFRWPPYLVAVWVLVLLLTHVLHCLVAVLEKSLPSVKKLCQYFRAWTEEWWKTGGAGGAGAGAGGARARAAGLALAGGTALLYGGYALLRALHAAAAWALQPLLTDEDRRDVELKVTNYLDEVNSKPLTIPKS